MQHERFPAAGDEACEKTRDETPAKMPEAPDAEIRGGYGEVQGPHEDPREAAGEAKAEFDGGEAAAAAKRGATSAAGVRRKKADYFPALITRGVSRLTAY